MKGLSECYRFHLRDWWLLLVFVSFLAGTWSVWGTIPTVIQDRIILVEHAGVVCGCTSFNDGSMMTVDLCRSTGGKPFDCKMGGKVMTNATKK